MGLFGRKKKKEDEVFGENKKPVKCSDNQHYFEVRIFAGKKKQSTRCITCGWDRKHGFVCDLCEERKSKLKNDDLEAIVDPYAMTTQIFHPSCKENQDKSNQNESDDDEENPDFSKRQFDFNEGLERVIQISYQEEREIDVKLFFSKDDWTTFTRNYTEKVKDNFVRLIIEVSKKTNSSLISGGNYNFNDDFSKGYTLFVLMRYSDKKLLSVISNILRDKNFGCLPTNYSIHAHLNDENPNEDNAKEILREISTKIEQAFRTT